MVYLPSIRTRRFAVDHKFPVVCDSDSGEAGGARRRSRAATDRIFQPRDGEDKAVRVVAPGWFGVTRAALCWRRAEQGWPGLGWRDGAGDTQGIETGTTVKGASVGRSGPGRPGRSAAKVVAALVAQRRMRSGWHPPLPSLNDALFPGREGAVPPFGVERSAFASFDIVRDKDASVGRNGPGRLGRSASRVAAAFVMQRRRPPSPKPSMRLGASLCHGRFRVCGGIAH